MWSPRECARESAQDATTAEVRFWRVRDYDSVEMDVVKVTASRVQLENGAVFTLRRSGRWVARHEVDSVFSTQIVKFGREGETK